MIVLQGIGRVTQCLPAECGEDVVLAVLELFARRQSEENDVRICAVLYIMYAMCYVLCIMCYVFCVVYGRPC